MNVHGDDGMYMGVIQGTDHTDRIARFSIWNASAANGSNCTPGDNEGNYYTCIIDYDFVENRWYNLRIWQLNEDAGGQWWGAYIIDEETGAESWIGDIRAPSGTGDLVVADSFAEYFGEAVPCDHVPRSSVAVLAPYVNDGAGSATFGGTSVGTCSGGAVTPTIYGTSILDLGVGGCTTGGGSAAFFVPMAIGWRRLRSRSRSRSRT